LRTTRSKLMTEYEQKRQTFKPDYPEMKEIISQVNEIDRRISSEAKKISLSLKSAYDSTVGQEVEMQQRIEKLKSAEGLSR